MNKKLILKFNKPYDFEGKKHEEVDLRGLDNLTTKDLITADKIFISSGQMAAVNETSIGYVCIIASKSSDQPIEFFEKLPIKEGLKLKGIVTSFLSEVE